MPYPDNHKQKIKAQILNVATELFCRYGFDRVSITQVMQRAKLTHGAFYAYFASKENLYKESFTEALRRSRAIRLVKGPLSIKNLMQLVSNHLRLDQNKQNSETSLPSAEAFLSNDIGSSNVEIKKLYEQSYLRLLKLFETRLKALARLKHLPMNLCKESFREKSRAILACLVGALALAKTITQENERQAILIVAQKQILEILGMRQDEVSSL